MTYADLRGSVLVFRRAAIAGIQDYLALHNWFAYLAGWIVRLIFQIVFFAMISEVVDRSGRDYLLIGNAVAVAGIEGSMVVADMVTERRGGILPVMLATPRGGVVALLARTAHWPLKGLVTSLLVFAVLVPVFGLHLGLVAWLSLPFLLLLAGWSAWCTGCVVSALILRRPSVKWLALNLTYPSLMTFCGTNVPVDRWPLPVEAIAQVVPFTPGLLTVREVIAQASLSDIALLVARTLALGLVWLCASAALVHQFIRSGRREGTLDLA
jgi:ABC-2 type transport system permease protein